MLSALASSAALLAACGSSGSQAPVVYGADGSNAARIYNSPEEIYLKQQMAARNAQPQYSSQPYTSPAYGAAIAPASVEPAQLAPVQSAVYQQQPVRYETKTTQVRGGYAEVQPGDTVYAIARRFNVSPKAIMAENNLRPPYTLRIGQALRLPSATATAAPVMAQASRASQQSSVYTVRRGDTLYAVSRATGVSVNELARANGLSYPYTLSVGQRLMAPGGRNAPVAYQPSAPATQLRLDREPATPRNVADIARNASYTAPPASQPSRFFQWPIKGAVISNYGSGALGRRNEGVNIAAPAGTPVRAAADGEVVYRGSELDGYGNLLLVKHTDGFVTAYAHNDAMLVRKGQRVRQGQVIAKVGQTGSVGSPQLHFEIRQNLKSVDPTALLGSQ
ncbi:MAG: peptidoglycan DD-metalloendopeptidase family protein [Pseudomonadota bacterium]